MTEILQLPTPIKSSEDVKDYKLIQLPNGLKALLISDTSYDLKKLEDEQNSNDESNTGLKKSAAGLCIGTNGYYNINHIDKWGKFWYIGFANAFGTAIIPKSLLVLPDQYLRLGTPFENGQKYIPNFAFK